MEVLRRSVNVQVGEWGERRRSVDAKRRWRMCVSGSVVERRSNIRVRKYGSTSLNSRKMFFTTSQTVSQSWCDKMLLVASSSSSASSIGETTAAAKVNELVQFLMDEYGFTERVNAIDVIDKATNPNSMAVFKYKKGRYVKNVDSYANITVESHLKPLLEFFVANGVEKERMSKILLSYPPILSYDIEARIKPIIIFLKELGCSDPIKVVCDRPSLLGLDSTKSLPQIVEYLKRNDYSDEQILELVEKSI